MKLLTLASALLAVACSSTRELRGLRTHDCDAPRMEIVFRQTFQLPRQERLRVRADLLRAAAAPEVELRELEVGASAREPSAAVLIARAWKRLASGEPAYAKQVYQQEAYALYLEHVLDRERFVDLYNAVSGSLAQDDRITPSSTRSNDARPQSSDGSLARELGHGLIAHFRAEGHGTIAIEAHQGGASCDVILPKVVRGASGDMVGIDARSLEFRGLRPGGATLIMRVKPHRHRSLRFTAAAYVGDEPTPSWLACDDCSTIGSSAEVLRLGALVLE